MSDERPQKRIISIGDGLVKSQLCEVVRETVEETLSNMLDAEADVTSDDIFPEWKILTGLDSRRTMRCKTI